MSWMLSMWVTAALLALCGGEYSEHEGNSLSASGYHLCIHNETRTVTFLATHNIPRTVTKPCGGWLLWKSCTVTFYTVVHRTEYKAVTEQVTRCCDGYVQVGHYCALSVNRSAEFTAKPGSCPTADGSYPGSEDCEWDMDCPGWQKCCQRSNRSLCSDPTSSATHSENRGSRFNATVTVKADYEQLMSKDRGHLNHTRLLQAMVTGALQSGISVYFLSTWPVHPYRTATSLLVGFNSTVSLHDVTTKLHLLLEHIQEVSSVTVEDVDECAQHALHQCSPQADCNNTVGSFHCACRQGFIDADSSNPGAWCTRNITTEPPPTHHPPDAASTQQPPGPSTTGPHSTAETSGTAPQTTRGPVPCGSFDAAAQTTSAPHTSESSQSPLPPSTCPPPTITTLRLCNVTGTSFCVYWSVQSDMNQTTRLVVVKGSEAIDSLETKGTMLVVSGLEPGVLYNVTVTPYACGSQGSSQHISVRTDAWTLDGTTRLTNINFINDLLNTSSQAYKDLKESIIGEINKSLPPEMRDMATIEIKGFSSGSVVVIFTIIMNPNQSQDINNVSEALANGLMNSTKYTVDKDYTRITESDECASEMDDCSQWATCVNTQPSYLCKCQDGFEDTNPERPGRRCQAKTSTGYQVSDVPTVTTVEATTTTIPPAPATTIITTTTTDPALTSASTTAMTTDPTTTSTGPTTTSTDPTTTSTGPTTTSTDPTTTTTDPSTTSTDPTTTSTDPTTTTTDPTTTTTDTSTTSTDPTTTSTGPTTTSTDPTTTSTGPTTTTTDPTTTSADPSTTTTDPSTTSTGPTTPTAISTTSSSPPFTTAATAVTTGTPSTTTNPTTTTTTGPTTTTTGHITTTTGHITTTTRPTITIQTTSSTASTPTTALTDLTANTTTPRAVTYVSVPGAISVECRDGVITVTVSREFMQTANIRESALYLGQQGCDVNGDNSTHVQLTVAWNECDTRIDRNASHYKASVTLYNRMDQYISSTGTVKTPKVQLEIPIMCTYKTSMLYSSGSGYTGYDMFDDIIVGSGSFQVRVQLMNGTMPLPSNYSLSPEDAVVVDVSINTTSEHIKVVIDKCWATPNPNPADADRHVFLENSCPKNEYTKVLMNGNSSTSRISVQIFAFVNLNFIYLHCQIQICAQIGSDTCVPDCMQRKARSLNTVGRAFGTMGPIIKLDGEGEDPQLDSLHLIGFSCLGVGLTLFFIIGFVCLFYYQRNRIGHYNFSVKPKQENFTYLVFNT